MPQENPYIDRDDLLSLIRAEFVAHGNAQDPKQDYKAQRKALTDQLKGPGDIIAKRQHEGKAAACAYQVPA